MNRMNLGHMSGACHTNDGPPSDPNLIVLRIRSRVTLDFRDIAQIRNAAEKAMEREVKRIEEAKALDIIGQQ